MWRIKFVNRHGGEKDTFEPVSKDITKAIQALFEQEGTIRQTWAGYTIMSWVSLANVGESNVTMVILVSKESNTATEKPPVKRRLFYTIKSETEGEKASQYNFLTDAVTVTDVVRVFTLFLKGDKRWLTDYKWEQPPTPLFPSEDAPIVTTPTDKKEGVVYLIRMGDWWKIGKTINFDKRKRQIDLLLPEESEAVHRIETDDVHFLERHWHKRFANQRGKGEWFRLSEEDINEFKHFKRVETT